MNFSVEEPDTVAFKSAAIGEVPVAMFMLFAIGYLIITTPEPPLPPDWVEGA